MDVIDLSDSNKVYPPKTFVVAKTAPGKPSKAKITKVEQIERTVKVSWS